MTALVGMWVDPAEFNPTPKTPFREGKDAYWDFECGYDEEQKLNPYPIYSDKWREWNNGWLAGRDEDDL